MQTRTHRCIHTYIHIRTKELIYVHAIIYVLAISSSRQQYKTQNIYTCIDTHTYTNTHTYNVYTNTYMHAWYAFLLCFRIDSPMSTWWSPFASSPSRSSWQIWCVKQVMRCFCIYLSIYLREHNACMCVCVCIYIYIYMHFPSRRS